MSMERGSANKGMWFGVRWSKDWNTRTPWSFEGENMPYVGIRKIGTVSMVSFGPIAFVSVYIGGKQ